MLRTHENKGLLEPFRTEGGTRRYSSHDVERIGQITTLLATGLNLAGVEHVPRRFNGCAGPGPTHGLTQLRNTLHDPGCLGTRGLARTKEWEQTCW